MYVCVCIYIYASIYIYIHAYIYIQVELLLSHIYIIQNIFPCIIQRHVLLLFGWVLYTKKNINLILYRYENNITSERIELSFY